MNAPASLPHPAKPDISPRMRFRFTTPHFLLPPPTIFTLISFAVILLSLLAVTMPSTSEAQRRRRTPPTDEEGAPIPTLADLDRIAAQLSNTNPDEVREAIDLLSVIDSPQVVPHLETLLRSGQPDPVTNRALEALGGLAHPSAIEILTAFTHHRRTGARRRAFAALANIQDNRIADILESGLRDSDRSIRGAVALKLGEIGARGSLDVLFRAFERGVVEAAVAIGKLGGREHINRFGEYLERRPLAIMLSGYHEFVRRSDIPNEIKRDIVSRLGEISTPDVRRFLGDYLGTFPEDRRRQTPLQEHVEETLRRIPMEVTGRTTSGTSTTQEAE